MKKTTKKLNITKETITSFTNIAEKEMELIQGGSKVKETAVCSGTCGQYCTTMIQ